LRPRLYAFARFAGSKQFFALARGNDVSTTLTIMMNTVVMKNLIFMVREKAGRCRAEISMKVF